MKNEFFVNCVFRCVNFFLFVSKIFIVVDEFQEKRK